MSFSSERLPTQTPIQLSSDQVIRRATQVEIERLRHLEATGRLSAAGAELLEALQRDCVIHDF